MVVVVGDVPTVDISNIVGDFGGHRITCRMAKMTLELKQAVMTIRNECESHPNCVLCPFCIDWECRLMKVLHPDDWEPDEWEMEGENA